MADGAAPCVFLKRKRAVIRRRVEKRESEDSDEAESSSEDETVVVKVERKAAHNPMVQGSKKSKATRRQQNNGSSSDEAPSSSTLGVSYASTKTAAAELPRDMGATSTIEIDTAFDQDDTTITKKALEINKELKGKADDGVYRGLKNYNQYYEKTDNMLGNAGSGLNKAGPVRAPSNIRSTVRWDYDPSICKDYKETGFCGFGDSCKFMHDRTDYKHGWQLERDIEQGTYEESDTTRYEIHDHKDSVPFRCLLCRNTFKDPVVTRCKHYFCEDCALDHFKATNRCYICQEPTNGIFNPAKDVIALLKSEAGKAPAAPAVDSDSE